MTVDQRAWTDESFEILLSHVLRAGVLVAATIVALGGVIYLSRHGHGMPEYGLFRGEPSDLRSLSGIISDARSLSGRGLIQLGLLLLIATPVARVIFSVVGFFRQRDWMYVAITMMVLLLLGYSLMSG